jgi:phage repressor protein C with HTH and peptisase S24 domain
VAESLGMDYLQFVHPQDRGGSQFQPLIDGRQGYSQREARYLTKSGEIRWLEVQACLALNEAGQIIGTSGTLSDDKQGASNAGAVRVFTSCDSGSGAAVTYYTVLTKAGGGEYIFAEIGAAGSQSAAQDAEAKIREAAGTVIQ